MRRFLPALVFLSAPALAQDAEIQKQLMQRQQHSDAFTLQLRQSQEALRATPADRAALESRQLSERQRLEYVSGMQLREVQADTPPALRPYERQKADDERRALIPPDR